MLNASRRSVQAGRALRMHGNESLVAVVETGEVAVYDAVKVTRRSISVQRAAVELVRSAK